MLFICWYCKSNFKLDKIKPLLTYFILIQILNNLRGNPIEGFHGFELKTLNQSVKLCTMQNKAKGFMGRWIESTNP